MQATFGGRRIVIFSGGSKAGDTKVIEEAKAIVEGGGNGSIMGRNAFQRPYDEAIQLLSNLLDIYSSAG